MTGSGAEDAACAADQKSRSEASAAAGRSMRAIIVYGERAGGSGRPGPAKKKPLRSFDLRGSFV